VHRKSDQFSELKLKLVPRCDCVELDAAASLHDSWHSVYFVENGLMNTLFATWQRQLFDPAQNSSGFPDLIAFADPAKSRSGGGNLDNYCLIEVKGPGDSLQNNQKRWLRYFSQHNIPAAVPGPENV